MNKLWSVIGEEIRPPQVRWRLVGVQAVIAMLPLGTFARLRTALYRLGGVRIGPGSVILGRLRLWGSGQLTIGSNTTLSPPCAICLDADVVIGDRVLIGHDTILTTGGHEIGPPNARGGPVRPQRIVIEDGVWIGAAAIVLPGVTLERGSVVAAGSVVTQHVRADTLVAGVPARPKREL